MLFRRDLEVRSESVLLGWEGRHFLVKTAVHCRTPGLGGLGQTQLPSNCFRPVFSQAMPSWVALGFLGVYCTPRQHTLSEHDAFLFQQQLSIAGKS